LAAFCGEGLGALAVTDSCQEVIPLSAGRNGNIIGGFRDLVQGFFEVASASTARRGSAEIFSAKLKQVAHDVDCLGEALIPISVRASPL
jgi:hypothetical protein